MAREFEPLVYHNPASSRSWMLGPTLERLREFNDVRKHVSRRPDARDNGEELADELVRIGGRPCLIVVGGDAHLGSAVHAANRVKKEVDVAVVAVNAGGRADGAFTLHGGVDVLGDPGRLPRLLGEGNPRPVNAMECSINGLQRIVALYAGAGWTGKAAWKANTPEVRGLRDYMTNNGRRQTVGRVFDASVVSAKLLPQILKPMTIEDEHGCRKVHDITWFTSHRMAGMIPVMGEAFETDDPQVSCIEVTPQNMLRVAPRIVHAIRTGEPIEPDRRVRAMSVMLPAGGVAHTDGDHHFLPPGSSLSVEIIPSAYNTVALMGDPVAAA